MNNFALLLLKYFRNGLGVTKFALNRGRLKMWQCLITFGHTLAVPAICNMRYDKPRAIKDTPP